MENAEYLFAAFAIIWAGLFAYVFVLVQRQRRLRRDIDWLKETLHEEKGETREFHYKETKEFRGQL